MARGSDTDDDSLRDIMPPSILQDPPPPPESTASGLYDVGDNSYMNPIIRAFVRTKELIDDAHVDTYDTDLTAIQSLFVQLICQLYMDDDESCTTQYNLVKAIQAIATQPAAAGSVEDQDCRREANEILRSPPDCALAFLKFARRWLWDGIAKFFGDVKLGQEIKCHCHNEVDEVNVFPFVVTIPPATKRSPRYTLDYLVNSLHFGKHSICESCIREKVLKAKVLELPQNFVIYLDRNATDINGHSNAAVTWPTDSFNWFTTHSFDDHPDNDNLSKATYRVTAIVTRDGLDFDAGDWRVYIPKTIMSSTTYTEYKNGEVNQQTFVEQSRFNEVIMLFVENIATPPHSENNDEEIGDGGMGNETGDAMDDDIGGEIDE